MRGRAFFESDAQAAADTAANAMADHGLDANEVNDLANEIAGAINDYFSGRDDG